MATCFVLFVLIQFDNNLKSVFCQKEMLRQILTSFMLCLTVFFFFFCQDFSNNANAGDKHIATVIQTIQVNVFYCKTVAEIRLLTLSEIKQENCFALSL